MTKTAGKMVAANGTVLFIGMLCLSVFSACRQPEPPQPKTEQLLSEISADSLQAHVERLVSFETRHSYSDTTRPDRGIGAARRWLTRRFKQFSRLSGGRLQVIQDRFIQEEGRRIGEPVELVNIVAILPGSVPPARDRWIVVSGHYDSRNSDWRDASGRAPGANDDGSGTAVVMELARVLSRHRFESTLVFVAFDGEELGLLGSSHWAGKVVAEGRTVTAMITNDIVGNSYAEDGRRHDHLVRVFSEGVPAGEDDAQIRRRVAIGGENDSPSRQLARYVHAMANRYEAGFEARVIYRRDRYLRGGDHIPFNRLGIPAIRLTEPNELYHRQHQDVRDENGIIYGDLPEAMDFNYLARVARVNAATLAELAAAPAAPQDVSLVVEQLTNSTTLRWTTGNEPDLAGYRIVWRPTHEAYWIDGMDIGMVTEYTLPDLSKDNYFFGLQARDTEGHLSPVTFPF